ncbi:MAG: amino acid ABC transporter substrate-binding protein [Clostridiales bacterium]|nr:amino acid ABC transporter substrate-binding protein [Clostridiales bacterium]
MKKAIRKIIALVLSLLMLAVLTALPALAEEASLQAILDKGQLILGLDDSFPPMGFRNEANEIVGFDIDVAQEVCNRLGVELLKQPIDWSAKELELAAGNIDCIWNGMSITPERQESMSMTFPYLNNAIEVYVKADSGIATLEDLAGKKVAVQGASYAEDVINSEEYAQTKASLGELLSFDDYLTALLDLQAGGVDAVLMDRVVGDYKITGMGVTDIKAAFALADDNFGIGFRKEDGALRDRIEGILIEMKQDGKLAEIATQWFGSDLTIVPAE